MKVISVPSGEFEVDILVVQRYTPNIGKDVGVISLKEKSCRTLQRVQMVICNFFVELPVVGKRR